MTKVLIATDKPFAAVAVNGIREIVEKAGYELVLLEKYGTQEALIAAVADVDAMIIRSDKATKEVENRIREEGEVTEKVVISSFLSDFSKSLNASYLLPYKIFLFLSRKKYKEKIEKEKQK